MRSLWLLPVLLFALNGCTTYINAPDTPSSATLPQTDAFQVYENLVYTPPDWPEALRADVYLPDTPGVAKRPAALVVHGGGWQGRSKDDMTDIAKRLARSGIVAVNVTYRFAPQYKFPAQLHDMQQAMAWIHENANAWGIDTSRIAGVGYSSGAHLVSLLALVASEDGALNQPTAGSLPSWQQWFPGARRAICSSSMMGVWWWNFLAAHGWKCPPSTLRPRRWNILPGMRRPSFCFMAPGTVSCRWITPGTFTRRSRRPASIASCICCAIGVISPPFLLAAAPWTLPWRF